MTEITANEIDLYNIFIDELGSKADELIAQKKGTEYAEALKASAEDDMQRFLGSK